MKVKKAWIPIFLAPAVILFLLIYAVPLVMVFATSLCEYKLTSKSITFIGLQNYIDLFQDPAFHTAFTNTIIWILIHCILHVAMGCLIALLLYKKPRGWKFIRTAYMVPNIISNAAMGMIFVNIFNPQFGVVNSILKMVGLEELTHNWLMDTTTAFPSVTMVWFLFAGYTTTLILAQALSVDESVLEAARVDGATNFQIDIFIMLPLLKKIIGTTMVMAATYMLQMFDLIYITTNGGPGKTTTNLPLLLYGVFKSENNYGYANTIGVMIIVLGAIVMVTINKALKVNEEDY
ncbi:carbohydrate ABC transporter permease [Butyricicoccus pullicaecorum]|uniref:ABC transporter permease n=1 Tax=Butyricicoccus pullicaecorum TaxID=501571 RepID=A0A1Y4LX93_9FIRM|nr:sugar ABC transporter permease [Butyricicoccus pullicaecorum]MDY2968752.1 sugar ABC transporter permease [Butyricicoccus pullicaecorum]OUP53336.1 ABC transporter permease [Butyricicoccus pullicaecorum]OUP60540.1 ABC transporter permease [Butyricicoccus pullicaecorum]HJF52188.1 sugar ABC transporter permease [Butyricicoccus pullicaecorum]